MIAPRYLPRLSEDLPAWNLFAPATEEDREWAVGTILPRLAALPWPLSRTERITLARLQEEGGHTTPRLATEAKLGLLCLALHRVLDEMDEECHVRFGEHWFKVADGSRWVGRPAREWAGITARVEGDWFDLSTCPTPEEVDRFGRWVEQALLRYARKALREMASDVLEDAFAWLKSGDDVLDHPRSVTVSLTPEMDGTDPDLRSEAPKERVDAEYWEVCFHQSMHGLGQILTRARYLALMCCFERIYAHRSGNGRKSKPRLSDRKFEAIQRNVKKIEDQQRPEATPLVCNALAALRELAACDRPPARLQAVMDRHTRNPRTKRVRAR
jgi:hypothetical protein